jgi:hypothetical protein
VGFFSRLFGGGEDKEARGDTIAKRLDALAQLDRKWSSEALRRRVRDVFFAVQRSWIERNPEVGGPFMTDAMNARQKLRIDGLIHQHRIHQLENPLIEDLDFVGIEEAVTDDDEDRVVACLEISVVETIRDDRTGALVAGKPNVKQRRTQYWVFVHHDGKWLLADVEQRDEGKRHMRAPLVGDDYVELSPESILRERFARGEIELEEFEAEMAAMLEREKAY